MEMNWKLQASPDPNQVARLQKELTTSEELAKILLQRGIFDYEGAKRFFLPETNGLHEPMQMKDMDKAVERLERMRNEGEKVMVFGDYDVDGTTAVSLVSEVFRKCGIEHLTYIPDRYVEGYGLSLKGMEKARESGCSLVIALDCGIKGHHVVEQAAEWGLDMIICDHHQPGATLPAAHAVLDPKRSDCPYPFKELSGCGVGFKLMQAWTPRLGWKESDLDPLTDLLAVSIAADIVPIVGENRTLMHKGLGVINETPRTGLRALMKQSNRGKIWNTQEVVFQLAPRINAAGRIEHGQLAVELLTTNSEEDAERIAAHINELNLSRRSKDADITGEALEMLKGTEDRYTSVVCSESWHKGVIGIAASRLIETHYRPTVVLTASGNVLAGSARSVKGFDLYTAIDACKEHLIQFGGHAFAAGMTLRKDQLESFKAAFEEQVRSTITDDQRVPTLWIDLPLDPDAISRRFYNSLQRMGPFGPGNMTPVFACFGLLETGGSRKVGGGKHLKLQLRDESGIELDGIAFGMGDKWEQIQGQRLDVAFTLDLNVWNGIERIQLMIKDVRPSAAVPAA